MVKRCPACQMRVLPTSDGKCPQCQRSLAEAGDIAAEASAATDGKVAEPAVPAAPPNQANAFPFQERLWSRVAVLFALYWLVRWLMPSLLPEGLRTAGLQVVTLVCGCGGLLLTAPAALMHGIRNRHKVQDAHRAGLVKRYSGVPAEELPDLRATLRRRGAILAMVGGPLLCIAVIILASTNSDDVAIVGMLFLMFGTGLLTVGVIMRLAKGAPSRADLAASIAEHKTQDTGGAANPAPGASSPETPRN